MKVAKLWLDDELGDAGLRGVNANFEVKYEGANIIAVLADFTRRGITHVQVNAKQVELLGDAVIKPGLYELKQFVGLELIQNLIEEEEDHL